MSITKEQVNHIAELARLGLDNKEKAKIQKELSAILKFVNQLNEVKTDKVKPLAQVTGLANVMRRDEGRSRSRQETKKLLESVPDIKDDHIKVRTIL